MPAAGRSPIRGILARARAPAGVWFALAAQVGLSRVPVQAAPVEALSLAQAAHRRRLRGKAIG